MKRVAQSLGHFDEGRHVKKMEAEGVSVSGLIEVSAIGAVPDSNIWGDLGGDELCQPTESTHCQTVSQSENKVFCGISLDWFEILDLIFLDQVPHHRVVQVEIA